MKDYRLHFKQTKNKIVLETSENGFPKTHIEITDEIMKDPQKKEELIRQIEKLDF